MAKPTIRQIPIALIGGETLLGKEVRELLDSAGFAGEVKLFSAENPHTGILTTEHGEPAVMPPLEAADLSSIPLLCLAGPPEASPKALEQVTRGKRAPVIIDASGGLEDHPAARLRAPMAESEPRETKAPIHVIAHPAAIALALFLKKLQRSSPIRGSVAVAFEPASEQGQRGLDELQQQTLALLSFRKLTKDVYDAQVSFNVLPQYGSDAPKSLDSIESKIDRHLASLLAHGDLVPMPSLRLIQAPVFHGYSFSLWVEFENNPVVDRVSEGLASAQIEVRSGDEEAPNNVAAAGQSGITVGSIALDRNNPRACWFWIVADNLRIAAENAVEVAREFAK